MRNFLDDLRYGLRMLLKRPGLSAISVTALALGIGLTTMMWSITYGGLMRGLPFERSQDLVNLVRYRPEGPPDNAMWMPIHDFAAYREGQRSFEDLSAWYTGTVNVSGLDGRPERFSGGFITPSAFRLLRQPPLLGRTFADDDQHPGAPAVVMISWDLWQGRFGGDSAVVGRTLRANGVTSEIVGVMPRGFLFPNLEKIWLPLRLNATTQQPWGSGQWIQGMGRLRPGASLEQARAELETVGKRLEQEHPNENRGIAPRLRTFNQMLVPRGPRIMLWTMLAAVFGVLLIACTNVANLLLARAAIRTREVAVRTALGASRWRIVSQLLTEALAISLAGAAFGIGIALIGIKLFNDSLAQTQVPFWVYIGFDLPIFLFVLGITLLAALVSGLVPALQATSARIYEVLKDENRGSSSMRLGRFSKSLVVVELALAGGLLVGAGFMIQSVVQRAHFDYGVNTHHVFTARLGLFESAYPDSASRVRFWRELERRLEELPGKRGVALTSSLPGLVGSGGNFQVDGRTYTDDRDYPETRWSAVTPGFFRAFSISPIEGRVFTDADLGGRDRVALVSRNFASRHFEGQSPLGKRLRWGGAGSTQPWMTIVGVIPDIWYDGTDDTPTRTAVLIPIMQGDWRFLSLAIPADQNAMRFAEPVRTTVASIDRDQPIYFVQSLDDAIGSSGWFYVIFGNVFAVFGAAALLLSMIGVYGVTSFAVSRRTQEIGVRMALGAGGADVLRLFLRQGGLQIAIGLTLAVGLAFAVSRGLTAVLFQVDINNLLMYAAVIGSLAVTGFLAILIPSLRATRVDPLTALHYE